METDILWGLLYESTATAALTADELEALLCEARDRNEALEITGWLTYAPGLDGAPGTFTQYLEGSRSVIQGLFHGADMGGGIRNDPRHHNVRVVQEGAFGGGPPGCRLYPSWFMEWVACVQ